MALELQCSFQSHTYSHPHLTRSISCSAVVPTPTPKTTAGCPTGWLPAAGTIYISWPKDNSKECQDYNGCQWAGVFWWKSVNAGGHQTGVKGPGAAVQQGTCLNGASWMPSCTCRNTPNPIYNCRFSRERVQRMNIAATWLQDPALLNRKLEVSGLGRFLYLVAEP